ncbi:hypothetical protein LTR36_002668 [Oleoguttula mirabilis]|uniref:Telomere replication protein EST3 n=1 Tax=Oleoguttula mirabilis TaxID=1507867 RepID=A0AAV9JL89_9PEZI|nr:hypothetical protein LTR36_002668 [Oleoguttula mirabilis]
MASQYSSFLQSPNASLLASDASLVYITTTTEFKEAAVILKHLQAQQKVVGSKEQKVLSTIESQDGLALEIQTTLEFKNGGGAYLPGVDDNLLDERTVTFPMVHFVRFDAQKKIKQIRLYWDQGTLLKQVEAIGKSGRNWPIRDGSNQIDAVNKSVKAAGATPANDGACPHLRSANDVFISQHKKRESVSATGDPHASLSLFAARDPNEEANSRSYNGPSLATRASAKPAPRDFVDIAGDEPPQAPGSAVRSPSPTKAEGVHIKSGAGKHYATNRLFDENEMPAASRSPERKKTYKEKYDHFAFGNGEDATEQGRPASNKSNKNHTTFSFEDFSTPPKHVEKPRPDDVMHWGPDVQDDDPPSPAKRPIVHAARPDFESHFELTDDPPAPAETKPKTLQRQKGMGLYQDPLHEDSRTAIRQPNMNRTRRGDDFGTESPAQDVHHQPNQSRTSKARTDNDNMTDVPPAEPGQHQPNQSRTSRARADNDSHWEFGTPTKDKKIYKTAGDVLGATVEAAVVPKLKRARSTPNLDILYLSVWDEDEENEDPAEKRQRRAKIDEFATEAGVEPDATLSEDNGEAWVLQRCLKGRMFFEV